MRTQRVQLLAYIVVVAIAMYGAYAGTKADREATKAQEIARSIDREGDLSLCKSENRSAVKGNRRDAALEDTADLVRRSLVLLTKADRSDPVTHAKLHEIANQSKKIRTKFPPEKQSDCEARFEK